MSVHLLSCYSVSSGCGLPLFIQAFDVRNDDADKLPSLAQPLFTLRFRLRIEDFRRRVSSILGSGSHGNQPEHRLSQYRLLSAELSRVENNPGASEEAVWHMTAARLHLRAFHLFDSASSSGYSDRILELDQTAKSLITTTLDLDGKHPGFLSYCPFSSSQVFVCAAFVVLKISTNGFFRSIIDSDSSNQLLERAIMALRKMSVVNNDIPARLGDVLAFFCALPDPTAVGGRSIEDLRLKQVDTRLSMSIVHDFLRTWRSHFRRQNEDAAARTTVGNVGDKSFLIPLLCRYTDASCTCGSNYRILSRLHGLRLSDGNG